MRAELCCLKGTTFLFSYLRSVKDSRERVVPRGSDSAPPLTETPAGMRDMAARAWRLAAAMLDEQTIASLTAFAVELEARAAALEPPAQIFTHNAAAAVQKAEDDTSRD